MTGSALRGALGFLTRLPVRSDDDDWKAFAAVPATLPAVGYVVGTVAAIPFLLADVLPGVAVAAVYLVGVYLLTGVHHVDGLADCGDAAVVHGDCAHRREVLKDSQAGVGAVLAVAATVVVVALGALGVAGLPPLRALGVAVAAEVGAKLGMALLAAFGDAPVTGFGSALTDRAGPAQAFGPALVASPALLASFPSPAAAAAVAGGVLSAAGCLEWANRHLGGPNGDVFGAANEVGRAIGLHLGVITWAVT